jgi:hypothetical protein
VATPDPIAEIIGDYRVPQRLVTATGPNPLPQ